MGRFYRTISGELRTLDTSTRQLRKFGVLFFVLFLLIAGLGFYKTGEINSWLLFVAFLLILATLFLPRIFRPFYYVWMAIAVVLGFFVGEIILTVLYFLVVSPIAIARRMFRGRKSAGTSSSWVPRDLPQPREKMDRLF